MNNISKMKVFKVVPTVSKITERQNKLDSENRITINSAIEAVEYILLDKSLKD